MIEGPAGLYHPRLSSAAQKAQAVQAAARSVLAVAAAAKGTQAAGGGSSLGGLGFRFRV